MMTVDLAIIGGGPAGMAAAIEARKAGIQDILILERDSQLGGILNQCIHNGFGLHTFKEELTGPEYASRYAQQIEELGIPYKLNTMVLDIAPDRTITAVNREDGLLTIQPKAIVLAMGCRERPRGALNIPGMRPAGVYTAGTAQRLVNIEGYMPGRQVMILGSGDIGLIMARRMSLEGAKVLCVAELMPYSGGLKRNIVQCLDDFGIPLKLSHTVVNVEGEKRVTGITIAKVENGKPVPGTEEHYDCDTLLLSCGLLPENELSRGAGVEMCPVTNGPSVDESLQTSIPGVFAAGNVLHVHDLVDYVSEEAGLAGREAAKYIQESQNDHAAVSGENNDQNGQDSSEEPLSENHGAAGSAENGKTGTEISQRNRECSKIAVQCEGGIRYCVPEYIRPSKVGERLTLRMRVGNVYRSKTLALYVNGERVFSRKRPVMAPGEMETVVLTGDKAAAVKCAAEVRLTLEEA